MYIVALAEQIKPVWDSILQTMQQPKISIQGGRPLSGTVSISGAKNAALPELAAICLTPGLVEFQNVPLVEDIKVMFSALGEIGVQGEINGNSNQRRLAGR